MSTVMKQPIIAKIIDAMNSTEVAFLESVMDTKDNKESTTFQYLPDHHDICLANIQSKNYQPISGVLWNTRENGTQLVDDYYLIGLFDGQYVNFYHIVNDKFTRVKESITLLEVRFWLKGGKGAQIIRLQYDRDVWGTPSDENVKNFVIASGYTKSEEWGNIIVIIKQTSESWTYVEVVTPTTHEYKWVGGGSDIVTPFTNTAQGTVIGTERDGYIEHLSADSDGIGHVHGWDNKFDRMDAPSSTTLTDEQKAKIIKGVAMNGTFLNLVNPIFYPANSSASQLCGLVIGIQSGASTTLFCEYLINNSNVISIVRQSGNAKNYFMSLNNDRDIDITSVKTPTQDSDAANKAYVDSGLANKVNKQTETGSNVYLYAFDSSGDTKERVTTAATAGTIAKRGTNGVLAVGDASADTHAVNLKTANANYVAKQTTTDTNTYLYGYNKDGQVNPKIVDGVSDTTPTNVLSANQGKVLNDRIDAISAQGRYLSGWNCSTGLPQTNPGTLPYTYKAGDYYVVYAIGTTNYMPDGSVYSGTASTKVITETVKLNDTFRFDGTSWSLTSGVDTSIYMLKADGTGTGTTKLENLTFTGDLSAATGANTDLSGGEVDLGSQAECDIPTTITDNSVVNAGYLNKRILSLDTAPTTATVGVKGQLAFAQDTAKLYHCTAVDSTTPSYTWEEFSGGSGSETITIEGDITQAVPLKFEGDIASSEIYNKIRDGANVIVLVKSSGVVVYKLFVNTRLANIADNVISAFAQDVYDDGSTTVELKKHNCYGLLIDGDSLSFDGQQIVEESSAGVSFITVGTGDTGTITGDNFTKLKASPQSIIIKKKTSDSNEEYLLLVPNGYYNESGNTYLYGGLDSYGKEHLFGVMYDDSSTEAQWQYISFAKFLKTDDISNVIDNETIVLNDSGNLSTSIGGSITANEVFIAEESSITKISGGLYSIDDYTTSKYEEGAEGSFKIVLASGDELSNTNLTAGEYTLTIGTETRILVGFYNEDDDGNRVYVGYLQEDNLFYVYDENNVFGLSEDDVVTLSFIDGDNIETFDGRAIPITSDFEINSDKKLKLVIDAALNNTSEHPIQNKALAVLIPETAAETNKLTSNSEVDEKVGLIQANQLYADASQNNFETKAALLAATTFYNYAGTAVTPTVNDIAYVIDDETKDNLVSKYYVKEMTGTTPTWTLSISFNAGTYLPLIGGTMTGSIISSGVYIKGNTDTGTNSIYGGTTYTNGAWIRLDGEGSSKDDGDFYLVAQNHTGTSGATKSSQLRGYADGTLTWNNKNVITTAGNTTSTPIESALIFNTGTVIRQSTDDNITQIMGGSTGSGGARLILNGKDKTSSAGVIQLQANDGTNGIILYLRPDGTAIVANRHIMRVASPTAGTYSSFTIDEKGNVTLNSSSTVKYQHNITLYYEEGSFNRVCSLSFVNNVEDAYGSEATVAKALSDLGFNDYFHSLPVGGWDQNNNRAYQLCYGTSEGSFWVRTGTTLGTPGFSNCNDTVIALS